MIEKVTASALRCDFSDDVAEVCHSAVYTASLDPAEVRTLAAERAWGSEDERDICPKHRSTAR